MTSELPKAYDPAAVEQEVYARWTESGAFHAEPGCEPRDAYCIVIPPPNVTAPLHLGHALNNALQDVLVRCRRMQGKTALWMPGTDHAGIATQTVVEKRILAEEGRRRTDFPREAFVERIQSWKDEYEARITKQLQTMGCSCDWRRQRFTMDEVCARAVRETFFRLFRDGLIYRGKRLVNWDPATQTVLADDEVEHEQVHGHFWYMRYPLVEPVEVNGELCNHVTVATTRPETMLGDTAVAMNPADPRAEALIGKKVRLPIVGREIPIIADEHVVMPDPDSEDEKARFGTGFLKVTPAHDPDDYQIGQRHDLPMVNVMAPDGSISDAHGWEDCDTPEARNLIGMDRFEAREAVVEFFRQEGLLANVREYVHQVGHSYRSHVPIEPYLSDQWYIAVKQPSSEIGDRSSEWQRQHPDLVEERDGTACLKDTDVPVASLAGLALAPLLDGRLKFTPDRYAKTYQTWLENLRDWPISRQLWWGHRIPIWSGTAEGNERSIEGAGYMESREGEFVEWIPGPDTRVMHKTWESIREDWRPFVHLQAQTCENGTVVHYCVAPGYPEIEAQLDKEGFVRDPDVLDTWFSSALWPFSTMGWPEDTPELGSFYPGDVLCTAREIITLWVSRMVMMGQYCVGDIPFEDVFIHAMIQDGQGRKMSKSLGNGIDPLDIIDSHGADAMRYTLVSMTTQTQDVRMPVEEMTMPDGRKVNSSPKFDVGRNFCNKLWNASRFALMNLGGCPLWSDIRPHEHLADRWLLSRLNATIRDVTAAVDEFRFNEIGSVLYHFVWDDFCDWYLEVAKGRINAGEPAPKAVLAHALDVILRLLHPVAPFITEAIWAKLNEVAPTRGPGDASGEPLLATASWPRADAAARDEGAERSFAALQEMIRGIRDARQQHNVPPSRKVAALIEATGETAERVERNRDVLCSQASLGELTLSAEPVEPPRGAAAVAAGGAKLYVLDIIDVEAEKARLGKQKEGLLKGIRAAEGKLGNESFVSKAPAEVVQRERDRLTEMQTELNAIEKSLAALA